VFLSVVGTAAGEHKLVLAYSIRLQALPSIYIDILFIIRRKQRACPLQRFKTARAFRYIELSQ